MGIFSWEARLPRGKEPTIQRFLGGACSPILERIRTLALRRAPEGEQSSIMPRNPLLLVCLSQETPPFPPSWPSNVPGKPGFSPFGHSQDFFFAKMAGPWPKWFCRRPKLAGMSL